MRLFRPTILKLALLAFAAVLLPLALGLASATVAFDRLASSGSEAVVRAAETVGLARGLVEHVTAMERHARQGAILDDPAIVALYASRHAAFVEDAARLDALDLPPALALRLQEMREAEAAIHLDLAGPNPADDDRADTIARFEPLGRDARALLDESTRAVGDAAEALRRDAAELQARLVARSLWAAPLLFGVLAIGLLGVVRPLRLLDAAIRRIGDGDLRAPVQVWGPADVRAVAGRLEWLRARLRDLESDRARLFQHVSHELKTPLTSVREGAELLSDGVGGPLTGEQREILDIVRSNAADLQTRIEDLLRLSSLRDGEAGLIVKSVDLAGVVAAVLGDHRVAAQSRQLSFATELQPTTVCADPNKLRTLVDNLVTNAIKFSPSGGAVWVEVRSTGDGASLSVEDQGPGFAPEEVDRVFEAFYQGNATVEVGAKGTGLGLAIARGYARAHGGDIAIYPPSTGDRRRGARVVVHLPLAAT